MKPLPQTRWQRGAYVVEFAIVFPVLLTLLFGIIEIARIIYIYNTLQDATRRAAFGATVSDFRQQDAMHLLRQRAISAKHPANSCWDRPLRTNTSGSIIWP